MSLFAKQSIHELPIVCTYKQMICFVASAGPGELLALENSLKCVEIVPSKNDMVSCNSPIVMLCLF